MDSPTPCRQTGFSTRNSAVDVSQLDKVNAIPNKAADNVLLSNLCPDDQHYLKFLMEYDSSDSDAEVETKRHSSSGAWSPMVQSPMMNKRKGTKASYAITLSLEDISYIRPSWGISKGIPTIEVDGKGAKKKFEKKPDLSRDLLDCKAGESKSYNWFLVLLTLVVIFLTLPPYLAERGRYSDQVSRNRMNVSKTSRMMEIYRPDSPSQPLGEPILRVDFGLGVPANLKPEECTCEVYASELKKHATTFAPYDEHTDRDKECFSCLDWAVRANMRTLVEHRADTGNICYHIRWQSYDTLATPLIDCFSMEKNDQWFGLGDIHATEWALNKLQFDWIPLATNLTAETVTYQPEAPVASPPSLGSCANFTLFSTGGIFIGHLRSDFRLFVKVEQVSRGKRICIKATCNDRCSRVWSRADDLTEFRLTNNVLEYKICSSASAKSLISNHIGQKVQLLDALVRKHALEFPPNSSSGKRAEDRPSGPLVASRPHFERLLERESSHPTIIASIGHHQPPTDTKMQLSSTTSSLLPEGIGLIERTIFSTSPEFVPVLDGKTLRQYVDSVVKMGLRTSLILSIDSRWETYIGSLQLNAALFPKWRLLFEIIHNKGFKVMLTVRPFVDTAIGAASVNQLFEAGKLYAISQGLNGGVAQEARDNKETILRRRGLFSFRNETIEIGQNDSTTNRRPYVFRCKESQVGLCVLLDLESGQTRAWLINQIGRSELLTSNAADGILIAGTHPDPFSWDDHYREGLGQLVHSLYFEERIFTLPQWTGSLGYIQLASRPFSWDSLRSVVNSVLNLGLEGYSLIHPGSVWGDLRSHSSIISRDVSTSTSGISATGATTAGLGRPQARKETVGDFEDFQARERSNEELCIRWLQVSVFLPILQFNNLAPIERYGLQDLMQNLVRIRKVHIIAELKKNLPFTPLIGQSRFNSSNSGSMMALIRPVWFNQQHLSMETPDTVVAEQFSIGPDIMVAPVLSEGTRQRDIYLPNGFWHDELRQINIRGGKWLRNYPVELTEVAWFTRAKR